MTDSDDSGKGREPEPDGHYDVPSGPHAPFPGSPEDPYLPGPRPGRYPTSPFTGRTVTGRTVTGRPAAKARQPGSRRRPGPALAQRQLMERIAAGRKARQQRALLAVFGAVSAIVLLVAGSAWGLTSYVSSSIGRVNAGTTGTPTSGPLNILVAGVDIRSGLTPHQQAALHVGHSVSHNSDTLMVAHIPADHRYVKVISLPRDSWVDIPGHGQNKINAAFGIGGPKLMVRTVEHVTGLTINDYIEVDFLGFVKVIDALGGVNICLPFAVDDSYSGLHMAAGEHHVNGVTALEFARDRHSFALSDLARISDQQQLLSSMLSELISSGTLTNPLRLTRFLSAATAAVKVDQRLNITSLADQLRGIPASRVEFTTVPVSNLNYLTPTGQSAVLWDSKAAAKLFAGLKADNPPARKAPARGSKTTPARLRRSQVSVNVYNGTLIGGLSASTGAQLAGLGFSVHGSGLSWTSSDIEQTVIEYPPGMTAAARLVRKALPGATLRQAGGLARIRIVLGVNGHQVAGSQPGTAGQGSPGTIQHRTAAQDACHKQ